MALRDAACYTLLIQPTKDTSIAEIVEEGPSGSTRSEARYARVREKREGEAYSSVVYDALSGAKLASAGYQLEKDKKRRLQLHGPDEDVTFEFTGRLTFEWSFEFEGNKYRWTRASLGKDYVCSLDRKPDPRVEICLAREADKGVPARLQILHYNIERFPTEIKDVRGLETLLVMSLLCLIDAAEDRASPARIKTPPTVSSPPKVASPPLPPKKVIDEEDFEPDNPNEIIIGVNSDVNGKVANAIALLQDPNMLFIVLRTRKAEAAQKALEVSLGVTRFRHREGLEALHQYVKEEEPIPMPKPPARPQSPPRINLNDM
ncbi:hypothetical protein TREMEDRAFT_58756 [Tremella mesenterica DSM 1558]|uniref:uncharacterized protein n=1 Tax=Tremella mesenterica (strain ATCC 24925 / CBS 8224 / DSM 1558 / NBRC 9311 / NRRL Y-6157 / RJB 2259-6 / UBC 559-6) TaxID=578456 RepID=UPI0003F4A082|nr:uncharacterized protein TREMEDRAFT_58756 [Tremella mesenterica DSM 1558]EIW72585.1 hypothetical protein TREMEDRAFT_58756 [Tremella mesenterica DSM 1558]